MLLSCLLTLQPEAPAGVPANLGREAHAWFLDQIRAADPDLAGRLHAAQGLRPFTVSDLWGPGRGGDRPDPSLHPDRTYTLRVTSFSAELTSAVRRHLLPNLPPTVSLAGAVLRVAGATTDPAAGPWAGEATWEELVQRHTLGAESPHSVGLRFASPTVYRVTGKKWAVPLPLPALVFGGLLDKWNAFSPVQLHPDLRRFAEECLTLSSYRLQTRRVSFGPEGERGSYTGFTGTCWYRFEVQDRYWMGLVRLLAAFSLYAGAGLRSTMGLGQTRAVGVGG